MKITDIKATLSQFSLFKELNDNELEKIVGIANSKNYKKNNHIFLQGEPLENVYFIFEGKIKVYKSDISGKEQIVAILKKGEMFPHVGFFRDGSYPGFAEALETSKLISIPKLGFEKVLIENPVLCIKVFRVLGEKIVDLQNRLEEQILNTTYEQITKLLIRLGDKHGIKKSDGSVILRAEFTNKDLANMIGTTRETVSRTLTKLRKDMLIEIDPEGNMIIEPSRLLEEILK